VKKDQVVQTDLKILLEANTNISLLEQTMVNIKLTWYDQ